MNPKLRYAVADNGPYHPSRKHGCDAGIDLYANESVTIPPHSARVVPTGVYFDIPEGIMLQLLPKSRSNFLIGAGVVDPGYQGEILVKVVNFMAEPLVIERFAPLAQAVQVMILHDPLEQVALKDLYDSPSDRGAEGGIVRQR